MVAKKDHTRTLTQTYLITKAKDSLLLGTIIANKLDEIRIGKLKKYFLTKVIGSLEFYFSKVG